MRAHFICGIAAGLAFYLPSLVSAAKVGTSSQTHATVAATLHAEAGLRAGTASKAAAALQRLKAAVRAAAGSDLEASGMPMEHVLGLPEPLKAMLAAQREAIKDTADPATAKREEVAALLWLEGEMKQKYSELQESNFRSLVQKRERAVAKETSEDAAAAVGDLWREVHMTVAPFYRKVLWEQIQELEHRENTLLEEIDHAGSAQGYKSTHATGESNKVSFLQGESFLQGREGAAGAAGVLQPEAFPEDDTFGSSALTPLRGGVGLRHGRDFVTVALTAVSVLFLVGAMLGAAFLFYRLEAVHRSRKADPDSLLMQERLARFRQQAVEACAKDATAQSEKAEQRAMPHFNSSIEDAILRSKPAPVSADEALLRTPPSPAPIVGPGEMPPPFDWIPTAAKDAMFLKLEALADAEQRAASPASTRGRGRSTSRVSKPSECVPTRSKSQPAVPSYLVVLAEKGSCAKDTLRSGASTCTGSRSASHDGSLCSGRAGNGCAAQPIFPRLTSSLLTQSRRGSESDALYHRLDLDDSVSDAEEIRELSEAATIEHCFDSVAIPPSPRFAPPPEAPPSSSPVRQRSREPASHPNAVPA